MNRRSGVIEFLVVSLTFLGLFFPIAAQNCFAVEETSADSLEKLVSPEERRRLRNLDARIILELIKLARFNADFHETANVHWPWRSVLYPLAKESAGALSFANVVSDINQRGRSLHNPANLSNGVRRRGLYTTATGKIVGGAASALELTQNGIVALIASKKGFSPKDSLAFVKKRREFIMGALEQRDTIISGIREGKSKELLRLESLLLRRIKNRLIREFKRWSALSREQMWNENVFFALDVSQNSVNFSNNILSLGSKAHPNNSKTASILGLTASSIATLNPLIRTATGKLVRKYQRWKLDKALPEEPIPNAEKLLSPFGEEQELFELAKSRARSERQLEEFALLVKGSQKVDAMVEREQNSIEKLRRVATQQAISGPLIGATNLAQKILVVNSEFGRGSATTNNQLRFAGRLSQVTGQSYSLINTPTTQVLHFLKHRKLKQEGKLPSQLLDARRKRLDEIEKQVKGWIVEN